MASPGARAVLIAGGGVGGLAVALGLAQKGIRSILLEKASALGAIGADQQRPGNTLAGSEPRRNRRAVRIVAEHFESDEQIDQVVIFAGFQQYAV